MRAAGVTPWVCATPSANMNVCQVLETRVISTLLCILGRSSPHPEHWITAGMLTFMPYADPAPCTEETRKAVLQVPQHH